MSRRNRIGLTIAAVALCCLLLSTFHPGVRYRGRLLARKLSGETPLASWTHIAVAMAPSALRPRLRDLISATPTLPQWIEALNFPTDPDTPHNMYFVLDGPTGTMEWLDCHFSVLQAGETPHPPHQHLEEEIIVPMDGEVEIIRVDPEDPGRQTTEKIAHGQLVFHSPNKPHTIRATGPGPSTYLVLRWRGKSANFDDRSLESLTFDFREALLTEPTQDFETVLLLESSTPHLGKLHAHASTMPPGAGYDAHRDPYDVVIILLSGVVETLGQRVSSKSLIFYPADRPHGLKNVGGEPARYLVFEFHTAAAL